MNPLRLVARNYRSFDQLDLALPAGTVAILGENGAGKSSIVQAIDLAIFGPESRSLADCLSDTAAPDEELRLSLWLEHAGETYEIRRTYSGRGRGRSTLDFFRFEGEPTTVVDGGGEHEEQLGGLIPITCESAKATQELIERTLGLSRETFRASAFLAQGDGAAFTEAAPRERKRILSEVLGLERYDERAAAYRDRHRDLDRERLRLQGAAGHAEDLAKTRPQIEDELAQLREEEVDLADQVADREREREQLAAEYQQARDRAAERATAAANVQAARERRDRLDTLSTAADEALTAASATRDEIAALATPGQLAELERHLEANERQRDAYRERQTNLAAAQRGRDECAERRDLALANVAGCIEEAARARAQADEKRISEDATCQTCGQPVADEAKARAISELARAAAEWEQKADANREAAARQDEIVKEGDRVLAEAATNPIDPPDEPLHLDLVRRVAQGRVDQQQRARLEERLIALQATINARPATDDLLEADRQLLAHERTLATLGDPVDIDEIKQRGILAAAELQRLKTLLEQIRIARARLDERLANVAAAEKQLADLNRERETLESDLAVTVALERAFSPDGIPALIVENAAIPYLETEANRVLAAIANPKLEGATIELRTQAELKSGDGLRDTLDIVIATGHGPTRLYESWSGGEKTRINLALRLALARLLAHRRGAESRLLVIDEPDGIDEKGVPALIDVLRSVQDDFERIYLVSHVPALRDSFGDVVTCVIGHDGRSRIEEIATLHEVAA